MGWGAFDFRFGYYFIFFTMVINHTIQTKKTEVWPNSGARADPKVLPSQWRFSVGAQARGSQ